ncbi:DUF3426 domain-containing protein [Xanthomonas campestris]|uniref:DUF3426 domain-containing protein n=1 Tax=Xanthomonas campestris TaxID=339 RepID=UPI002B234CC2|nr:DUF3426 domain-containing protein [Xanthomonas campestris]MEA9707493.1 DUF3426 domain-containing protein [Xanthomonas campestris pv. raphani]MEA9729203.1 DUF3426 domain-containing protein [Xanthomonas campestris pv. raphani]MEA9859518.1 DUF3426 domain-containing protein [Xanthomonas campestris pv. raphani]MEA9940904.1 DUF3426 domain-containing protein [Xanthomonas campestris pv. raphani]
MSETPPPRRPLATFLRAAPAAPPLVPTPPAPSTEPADTAVPALESAPVAAPLTAPVPAPVRPLPAPPRSPEAAPPGAAARAPDTLIAPARRDAPLSASPLPLPATPPAPVPAHSSAQTADPAMRRSADDRPTAAAAIAPAVVATSTAPLAPAAAAHATNAPDQPAIAAQSAASAPGATVTQTPQASPPANQDGQPAPAARQAAPAPEAEAGAPAEAEVEADRDVTAPTSTPASKSTSTPASPSPSPTPTPTLEPAFARRGLVRPRLRASGWQWAVLVGLVLLLGLQIVIADRARLAGDARWRPLVSAACAVARCALPPWRDPATLTLLTRDVRPLPAYPGVLQIQASFRNDARWAQAWPWLQLSLSDADGRVIGTRVFSPQDYLGQAPAAQDTLAPGQAVQVAFRVREPAASTAAFSFDFR